MTKMKYNNIIFTKTGNVAKITLNRPHVLNAINREMLLELKDAFEVIQEDSDVKIVVITGAGGKAFSSGADIKMFARAQSTFQIRSLLLFGTREVIQRIERLEKPVIAAVDGLALGGGLELALACDIIIASERTQFGLSGTNLGLVAGWGGTSRMAKIVGVHKAKELLFTGRIIDASEAERLGIVNKVVPTERFEKTVNEMVNTLLSKSQIALRLAKEAINRGIDMETDKAILHDAEIFSLSISSEDAREGLRAFMEKRKPLFKGT